MHSYRLLLLDKGGLVVGHRNVDCSKDRDALAVADRELRKCEYVEVWDGGRPVCIRSKPLRTRSNRAKLLRCGRFLFGGAPLH
jgi:hypothetical protein